MTGPRWWSWLSRALPWLGLRREASRARDAALARLDEANTRWGPPASGAARLADDVDRGLGGGQR